MSPVLTTATSGSACEALAWAIGISVIGGGIFVPWFLRFIRLSMPHMAPTPRSKVLWIGVVVPHIAGLIERVAFAAMMYAMPEGAPIAMGAWVAVKMATTWHRDFGRTPHGRLIWASHAQLSLLASFVSMLFAAAGGIVARHVMGLPILF